MAAPPSKMKDLEEYKISPVTGFGIENPATSLPNENSEWMDVINNAWDLYISKKLRDRILKLPEFDMSKITEFKQILLAHIRLSMLASMYVWQDGADNAATVLPKVIAVPLWHVSEVLGSNPIVCYHDFLANFTPLIDDLSQLEEPMEQLKMIQPFSNDTNMHGFVLVGVFFEIKFAPFIPIIVRIAQLSHDIENHKDEIIKDLNIIASHIHTLRGYLDKLRKHIDTQVFYDDIRPFFSGWHLKTSPLPEGLIYGVSDVPYPANGGSNAQSGIIQSIDAVLGITHYDDFDKFIVENREYMIKQHREFLEDLEKTSVLRDRVMSRGDSDLTAAYNNVIKALKTFRSRHVVTVTEYVVIPANASEHRNFENLQEQGTGGTTISSLKTIRDKTGQSAIHEDT